LAIEASMLAFFESASVASVEKTMLQRRKRKTKHWFLGLVCYGSGTELSRAPAPNIALVRSASDAE
jgi:hypothetical protein